MATLGGLHNSSSSNSVNIDSLARFAVEEHNKKENALLKLARVIKAQEQLVAGTLHHLTLEIDDAGNKKIYQAKVWVKPWMNFKKLQEFTHISEPVTDTPSADHVQKDGDGSGYQSVAVHDPAVQDAANHILKTMQMRSNSLPYILKAQTPLSTAMASSLRLPPPQLKRLCIFYMHPQALTVLLFNSLETLSIPKDILLRDGRSSATTSTFGDDFPLKSVDGDGKHLKTSVLENENSESKPDERSTGTRAENSVKPTKPPKGKVDEIFGPINEKVHDELLNSLIKVNVEETTKVTQAVLPGTSKRKKGYCEYWFWFYECIPSDPLYDAIKVYIDQFSRWLYVADPIHWW